MSWVDILMVIVAIATTPFLVYVIAKSAAFGSEKGRELAAKTRRPPGGGR
jgi:hypothetical protein